MIVAEILQLFLRPRIPVIPLALVAQPILAVDIRKENHTRQSTDPHHPQTDAESCGVRRSLGIKEDIAGDQPTAIPNPNLHGRRDGLLVVPTHIVADPAQQDRLRHIPPARDGVQSKVPPSHGHRFLTDQDDISDRRNHASGQREREPVAHAVTDEGCDQCNHRGYDIDWDAHYLRAD